MLIYEEKNVLKTERIWQFINKIRKSKEWLDTLKKAIIKIKKTIIKIKLIIWKVEAIIVKYRYASSTVQTYQKASRIFYAGYHQVSRHNFTSNFSFKLT